MTTHPHLDGLIRNVIAEMRQPENSGQFGPWQFTADNIRDWADRIEAALAALPGGGVDDSGDLFERAYAKGYRAALGAAAAECRRQGEALDYSGNPYVRYADAIKCASAIGCLRVPEISPTPTPHEADRNG